MNFIYGLLTATIGITIAEMAFSYSLGEKVEDVLLKLFGKAKSKAISVETKVKKAL